MQGTSGGKGCRVQLLWFLSAMAPEFVPQSDAPFPVMPPAFRATLSGALAAPGGQGTMQSIAIPALFVSAFRCLYCTVRLLILKVGAHALKSGGNLIRSSGLLNAN